MVEYGEPVVDYGRCEALAEQADLIVVIGTSLRVYPANELVDTVKKNGGTVALLTRSDTPKDDLADIHLRGDLSVVMPEMLHNLKQIVAHSDRIPKKIRRKVKKI